jgi:hypothetical protein
MSGLIVTVDDQRLVRDVKVVSEKRCNSCHRILPIDSFYRNDAVRDGHEGMCKRCKNERKKARDKATRAAADAQEATNAAANSVLSLMVAGVQPLPPAAPVQEVRHVHPINDTIGTIVQPTAAVTAITALATAKGNPAANRRREVIAAVQLLLDMPENDCTAVIAMVQAYKGVLE